MDNLSGSEALAAAKAARIVMDLILDPNAVERRARAEAAAKCARRAADSAQAAHEACPTYQSNINMRISEEDASTAERGAASL